MCGLLASTNDLSPSQRLLLQHRGPDESYFESINGINIQFNRLSITGIHEGSHPIKSPNGRWSVFVNGEIYNYKQLITSHGLSRTSSDVQVIALGLEKEGLSFVQNLRGMFAGLIIDRLEKKIYVFRDFFGEKPLYYSFSNGQFTIASEFRALLISLGRPIIPDLVALTSYAQFGYIEEPWTFDRDIKNILKGSLCEIDSSGIRVVSEIPASFDQELDLSNLLKTVLTETTHIEVAGGLALSGGLDSGAIAKHGFSGKGKINSYIFNFGSNPISREFLVACKNSILNQIPFRSVSLETKGLENQLKSLAVINDLPHSDLSGLGYLAILRAMKGNDKKVAFFGHGPDEFFWGYDWFNQFIGSTVGSTINSENLFWDTPAKSDYLLSNVSLEIQDEFRKSRSLNSLDPFLKDHCKWRRARAEISHSYLSANAHRQLDRLAMSIGIEPRTPFTDSRLYSWAQSASFDPNTHLAKRSFRSAIQSSRLANKDYQKQGFNTNISLVLSNSRYEKFFVTGTEIINSYNLFCKPLEFKSLSFEDKYRCAMLGYWLIALR